MKKEDLLKFSNEALLKEEKRMKTLFYMLLAAVMILVIVVLVKFIMGKSINFNPLLALVFCGSVSLSVYRLKAISEEVKARNLK